MSSHERVPTTGENDGARLGSRDGWALLMLTLGWVLAAVVCSVKGDFTLNDDWAYAEMVRRFLDTGRIEPTSWTFTTTVSNVWLGALFSALFGFSNAVLRLSTLFIGWTGVLLTFAALRRLAVPTALAALGAAVLALNPIFYNLSHTFMTDVAFVSFQALGFYGLALWHTGRIWTGTALATAGIGLAVLSRQPGVMAVFAVVAVLALRFIPNRRVAAWLLGGVTALGVLVLVILRAVRLPNIALEVLHQALNHPQLNFFVGRNMLRTAVYIGLGLLPLLPFLVPTFQLRRGKERFIVLAAALFGVLCFAAGSRVNIDLTMGSNILHAGGIGPFVLHGWKLRPTEPIALWWFLAFLGAACFALFVVEVPRRLFTRSWAELRADRSTWFCLFYCLLYIAPASTRPAYFDRYLLPLLPVLTMVVFMVFHDRIGRRRLAVSWILVGVIGVYAVVGTRDYLVHHSLRTELVSVAREHGAETHEIEAGFEFAGAANYRRLDSELLARLPANEEFTPDLLAHYTLAKRTTDMLETSADEWRQPHRFVVSHSAHIDGFTRVDVRTAWRFVPPGRETLYLHRRN